MSDELPAELILELQKQFIEEINFMLEECEESFLKLEDASQRNTELSKIFRVAHSIKGSAAAIGLGKIAEFAHTVEDCLSVVRNRPELLNPSIISLLLRANDAFKKYINLLAENKHETWSADTLRGELVAATMMLESTDARTVAETTAAEPAPVEPSAEESASAAASGGASSGHVKTAIKLDASRLDSVLDLVGELVVIKSQVLEAFQGSASNNLRQNALLALFDKTVRELQDKTLTMRLTTIKPIFVKLQRIVRDVSQKLKKPIEFHTSGEDLELDRSMIELLADPLVHIIRNAVDHGIESPAARQNAGKPEKGNVWLQARQAGGRIVLEIKDDGAGVVREKVLKRAIERGLITEAEGAKMSDSQVCDLLFRPGFSTAEVVSDISGRGVGLDVVKTNILRMKGMIEISTVAGKGSTFRISLPLTTAITDGIVVVMEGIRVILPMDGIREIAEISDKDYVDMMNVGYDVADIQGKLTPIVRIGEVFNESELHALRDQAGAPGTDSLQGESRRSKQKETIVVVNTLTTSFGIVVDAIVGQSQVVVKPLGAAFKSDNGLSGVAILGDGKVGLVLDLDSFAKLLTTHSNAVSQERHEAQHGVQPLNTQEKAVA